MNSQSERLTPFGQKLKNNKSPGWDGLTAEFYKTFWGNIRTILHSCDVESIRNGSLSPSQRIGNIVDIVTFVRNR